LVANQQQNSNSKEKGTRVYLTFNAAQIELIDSLKGEVGDDRADVVKSIFLSWLAEKGVTPGLIRKRLGLK
jgi:hypothetical protein